jgi:hypothetical protein
LVEEVERGVEDAQIQSVEGGDKSSESGGNRVWLASAAERVGKVG